MRYLWNRFKNAYFYNMKLRYKLLLSHMMLIILPTVVLTFFLYSKLYDIIVSDTILSEQTLASQTVSTVEASLSLVTQASDSLAASDAAQVLLSLTENKSTDALSDALLSFSQLSENLTDGEVVTGIRLYLDEDAVAQLSAADAETSPICALSAVTSTYWYGIISTGEDTSLFCPGLYLSASEEESLGSLAYICALQTESGNEAYLAVYFSADVLADSLKDDVRTDNSATYILNERDTVVTASSSALSGAYYMTNTDLTELVGSVNQFSTSSFREDDIYVGYYTIEGTSWHLVSVLSADSLVRKGTLLVVEFAAIYFVFFILAALLTTALSGSIANRIARLIRQMQSVHHQKPQRIETKEDAKDEIGDLVNTYNYMSDEINALMDSQAQAAEDLKREEYNALQAQINPHFLYNSLDMISWLAKSGRQEDVSRAVQALSRFYKLSLSKKDSVNTLETELEHVSLYVQIQNMRFEDRISFVTDVPDQLLGCEIPKLTLQPIVENSIQHGIFEKPGKNGTILITGWTEGDDLCLLISDDGVGMTPEQLSLVLSDRGKSKSGSHIGVYNTHARIQLLYGKEYGLSYESTLGQGTEVLLRIPAVFRISKEEAEDA